jgi:type III pantothenate kinase
MTVRLVADVGNSRIKFGLVGPSGLTVAAVAPDDRDSWASQLRAWNLHGPADWAVAGVHSGRRDELVAWLRNAGASLRVIDNYRQLPLHVDVVAPEKVGIDRLLNAVGALGRVPRGKPVIIIDAGTAVTVDRLDETGTFRGGAIFPGLHLMAKALDEFTALLPLVQEFTPHDLPGRDTAAAIQAGVFHAVCGGIDRLVEKLHQPEAHILLAGGSTELAAGLCCRPEVVGSALTLEGLRRTTWPDS